MAQVDSQVETLDSTSASDQSQLSSSDLSRSASFSKLNARAPEFVPARSPATTPTTPSSASTSVSQSQVQLQVPPPPRMMMPPPAAFHNHHPPHVYSPHQGTAFHMPMQNHVMPVHPHHHHHHQIQHHVPVQNYQSQHHHHHRNHNQNHHNQKHNHIHRHDEGNQEVELAVEDQKGHKDQHHAGLSDESTQKILNQVEYYFGDLNLATTDHLMRFIHKDPEGYVPISVVASFKKIKAFVNNNSQLANVLQNSSKLVVSEDGKKVKRQNPLTESDVEELHLA